MAYVDVSVVDPVHIVNLGPLALLQPLIDQLDIAAIIDRHLPSDAEFSHGTVLAVLLAARLHSPTALVNVSQWAHTHGADYLWNIPANKLNDDRLARALDAFFEHRHAILADITHAVLRLTDLPKHSAHFDVTHLVLYGAYDHSRPRPSRPLDQLLDELRQSPAHICRGYLTRYKMLQLGLTSVVDDLGAVPIACHLFDGNRNGHTGVKEQYQLLRDFLGLPEDFVLVSDRGTCSAEHLARLLQHQHYAVCAGQWQDYRVLYEQQAEQLDWQRASYLSLEQQRRRDGASTLPLEEYQLAEVAHTLVDPRSAEAFPCRVLFVHSSAAAKECQQRRSKNLALLQAGLEKIAAKLERAHPTTTPESVARQIARLFGRKAAAKHFRWQLVPLTAAEQDALPPPRRGYRRQTHRLEFSCDTAAVAAESRHDGIYALVTTAPPPFTADRLFSAYKRQTHLERNNHELKTPLAVTPVFLKTPRRVEALVSLLFLGLQAYMTLERLYRQRVAGVGEPKEQRTTAEQILRQFEVCGLVIRQSPLGELVRASQLSAEQRRILNQLSLPTPAQILRRNLDPPPSA